jgi:hypothetical protein
VTPKSLPKKFAAKWQQFPTLDQVRDRYKHVKLHELRKLIRDVTCYRCPDSSVRYDPDMVVEALLDAPEGPESDEADDGDDSPLEPIASPKTLDALMLFRESMKIVADLRRTTQTQEQPLKLGLELLEKVVARLEKRLDHYDGIHDRMLLVTENLISAQAQRELEEQKQRDRQELRKQTLGVAAGYLPTIVEGLKQGSSPEAALALKAFASLEPEMVDSLLKSGVLEGEQVPLFTELRDLLRKKNPPREQQAEQNNSHAAPS